MKDFLEFIEPFADIIGYILLAILGYVWQSIKGRVKDAALVAVANTEKAFYGIHDRSEAKKNNAINEICSRYPFIPKATAEKWVKFALDNAKTYAENETHKALDELDKAMGGNHNEEISD